MPSGWRSPGGAYELQYTHPLCENSLIVIKGLSMGSKLVVYGETRRTHTHTHTHTHVREIYNSPLVRPPTDSHSEDRPESRNAAQVVSRVLHLRDRRIVG